ncbi:MAG: DUF5674 family protein [Patescibacteria group bacterium]|nr:DUF5674 family protein [Patescibacteria group bacterium]
MQIITLPILIQLIEKMAKDRFGQMVKAVVDVKQQIMAVDAELHADEETILLENGSEQADLWGINLYPAKYGQEDFIEFDSMINLRPGQNNLSRGVEDKKIQEQIKQVVEKLIRP